MAGSPRLAIVGATGAVGQEILKIITERNIKISDLILMADPSEAGKKIHFQGEEIIVRATTADAFNNSDIAFFAVSSEVSKEIMPLARENECLVIDNSQAFRMDENVPLIVPEVNPEDIKKHQGIIANPNCSTIIMAVAINPIHQAVGLKRVIVSTYQAVSGAGAAGLQELENSVAHFNNNKEFKPNIFQYPIAFNLIPQIDVFEDNGYSREEMKMVHETRKILHCPDLPIVATTVRVPVYRSHSEVINLDFEKEISVTEIRDLLTKAPGIVIQDDIQNSVYPMPLYTSNTDPVYVGRIRKDISSPNGIVLWAVADQIRKGAATNAVQIAEIVLNESLY